MVIFGPMDQRLWLFLVLLWLISYESVVESIRLIGMRHAVLFCTSGQLNVLPVFHIVSLFEYMMFKTSGTVFGYRVKNLMRLL